MTVITGPDLAVIARRADAGAIGADWNLVRQPAERELYVVSGELRPFDLLLFNRTKNPWGAHVAVYLGDDHAIHLSKKHSEPVIWPLAQFRELAEYRAFIGAKRLRTIGVRP